MFSREEMDAAGFVIDQDLLDGDQQGKARGHPIHATDATERFRLVDDDGNVYYTGRARVTGGLDADPSMYEAWKWGAYFAGTTRLDVLRNGSWLTPFA